MAAGGDPKWQKDAADQNFDYMFKLLIIGNSSVGKTSFLFRYADDSFTSAFVSTVGIDFKVKTVFRHDKRVKLQIWVIVLFAHPSICLPHIFHTLPLHRIRPAKRGIEQLPRHTTEARWASF
jgi:Ras-related protein Rab-3C